MNDVIQLLYFHILKLRPAKTFSSAVLSYVDVLICCTPLLLIAQRSESSRTGWRLFGLIRNDNFCSNGLNNVKWWKKLLAVHLLCYVPSVVTVVEKCNSPDFSSDCVKIAENATRQQYCHTYGTNTSKNTDRMKWMKSGHRQCMSVNKTTKHLLDLGFVLIRLIASKAPPSKLHQPRALWLRSIQSARVTIIIIFYNRSKSHIYCVKRRRIT